MADSLFKFLQEFYQRMQDKMAVTFLHELPMYRPFLSLQEQNDWIAKAENPEFKTFIKEIVAPEDALPGITNSLGGLMLDKCGYLDIRLLLKVVREYLLKNSRLRLEQFHEPDLQIIENGIKYQDIEARKVVYCDGPYLGESRWFSWLPLRPVKGEILTIEMEKSLEYIVNRGVFVLPQGKQKYKVGATFDNKDITTVPTPQARTQLEDKLKKLIQFPYQVVGHEAGIRPATSDRRPFIGLHPEFEPLAVFNGLGTKGVSLAPFLAKEFFQFLEQGRPLIPEVAITRHFSLYYNKF